MKKEVTLKALNTFSVEVFAQRVVTAHTEYDLLRLWQKSYEGNQPILLLGGGSNILFLENYNGTVLLNRIHGISVNEDNKAWHLHVGAGEIWHELVTYSLDKKMPGLENLALIPGCVGSAPIQNIGAYGVELQKVCEYVEIIHLKNGEKYRLSADECQFGYRDSIFKHHLRDNYAIIAVGLQLRKAWKHVLSYGALSRLDADSVTPRQIFETVCAIRISKLPDPSIMGNAGSFFKNPVIDAIIADQLLKRYPDAPYYPQSDGGVKLSAGWLIDRCQLKGYHLGRAAVHEKQALVLVNLGQATSHEIVELARYIRRQVSDKFSIWLEPEIRFISSEGEVDAAAVLS